MKKSITVILYFINLSIYAQSPDFNAKGIIYLIDGDFDRQFYDSVKLKKSGSDYIGAITFPIYPGVVSNDKLKYISNSVVSNYRSAALSNENIYVIESRGHLETEAGNLEDLPAGNFVSVAKIRDLDHIRPDYRFPVADNPTSISLDPGEQFLAVGSLQEGNELQIFELDSYGKPKRVLPSVSFFEPRGLNDVLWHPSGNFLAYLDSEDKKVELIHMVKDGKTIIRLERFGEPLRFEGTPTSMLFSQDGNYLYVLNHEENGESVVFQVKIDIENDRGQHVLLSKENIGLNPSQMVMHPNGKYIYVTNSENSAKDSFFGKSSLSIIRIQENRLTALPKIPLKGVMPSKVVFDTAGRNMAISFFQSFNYGLPTGTIQFYEIRENGNRLELIRQEASVNVPVGVHNIEGLY